MCTYIHTYIHANVHNVCCVFECVYIHRVINNIIAKVTIRLKINKKVLAIPIHVYNCIIDINIHKAHVINLVERNSSYSLAYITKHLI